MRKCELCRGVACHLNALDDRHGRPLELQPIGIERHRPEAALSLIDQMAGRGELGRRPFEEDPRLVAFTGKDRNFARSSRPNREEDSLRSRQVEGSVVLVALGWCGERLRFASAGGYLP